MAIRDKESSLSIFGLITIIIVVVGSLFLSLTYQEEINKYLDASSEMFGSSDANVSDQHQSDQPPVYQEVLTLEPSVDPSITDEAQNPLSGIGEAFSSVEPFTPTPPTPYSESLEEEDEALPSETKSQSRTPSFPLLEPQSDFVGKTGLLPGTHIGIIEDISEERIKFTSCTVAFSLPGKGKFPWAITAGHCGDVGDKIYDIVLSQEGKVVDTRFLGTIRYSSVFDSDKKTSDWGAIRLNPKAKLPTSTAKIPMRVETKEVGNGTSLCKYGSRTHRSCGEKVESNVLVKSNSENYQSGKTVVGYADKARLCALPGDSGGPVFDNTGIVGIISSTSIGVKDNKGDDALSCKGESESFTYYIPVDSVIRQIKQNIPDIDI